MEEQIQDLIKKYEDAIQSAKNLQIKGTGAFSDAPTHEDIKRLNVRIYERNSFVNDLKALLQQPIKNNR